LNISFSEMGQRKHGNDKTVFFCDELERLYGSENYLTGAAASFAVENWAVAGFWRELVQGLKVFKKNHKPDLPLGFFTWHEQVEGQHAQHTFDELKDLYYGDYEFDEDKFVLIGNQMLDGVASFWDGLNEERQKI